MRDTLSILRHFSRTRWGLRFHSRDELLAYQHNKLRYFLNTQLSRAPFYRNYKGSPLTALPIMDKAMTMAHFDSLNTRNIHLDHAESIAATAEHSRDFKPNIGDITVGLSSGTSGHRGVFLASRQERMQWAGVSLARMLTPAALSRVSAIWRHPLKVAFLLRANSNLYTTLRSRRIAFEFYDLLKPLDVHVSRLNLQRPDVLIAPASVLGQLAQAMQDGSLLIHPRQIISVAEVLEPEDQNIIATTFGMPVQQIYQCTEGFLGYTCAVGTLHLNEEFVHIEPDWLDDERTRFQPIITDFTRNTQIIARYRLNDILRVNPTPCVCGHPSRTLIAIEGRHDDILWLPRQVDQKLVPLFPDVVRRAMLLAGNVVRDYRIEQHKNSLHLQLDSASILEAQIATRRMLSELCNHQGVNSPTLIFNPWQNQPLHEKRRRIRCVRRPLAEILHGEEPSC